MGKRATALALAALLMLGLTGCGSSDDGRTRRRGGDAVEDALSGDSRRYQEMLENGRVHDTDGFLLDGENRHD